MLFLELMQLQKYILFQIFVFSVTLYGNILYL